MKTIIHAKIDLSDAKGIHLDQINDDGSAVLWVQYDSGEKEYSISKEQLQDMCATSSFKWGALTSRQQAELKDEVQYK